MTGHAHSVAVLVPMSNGRSSEETTVFAIYSTRRDAEIARDCLGEAGIRSFVSADDAGGMHPQLQRPHGVKLVGMQSAARDAHEVLEGAGLPPQSGGRAEPRARSQNAEASTLSLRGTAGLVRVAAIILIFLFLMVAG